MPLGNNNVCGYATIVRYLFLTVTGQTLTIKTKNRILLFPYIFI